MHGIFFDIGLGAGLAAAAGLRPFLPLLLAGALASAKDLGVSFSHQPYRFLDAGWWLLVVAVCFALAYALQLRFALSPTLAASTSQGSGGSPAAVSRADPFAAAIAGLGLGAGAILFAGTLASHRETWWPGLIGGVLLAALAQAVSGPIIAGARSRLTDRGAREALTVYLDAAALLVAAVVSLLHPIGYVLIALLGWFSVRRRARAAEKYAGLRILRR